jgi:DNA-binding beta-propeller fold protein YncE
MKRFPGSVRISAILFALALVPSLAVAQYTVVLGGLTSPRGLTFGLGGKLYVAQAGSGGDNGRITEIENPYAAKPSARNLVTGLISLEAREGEAVSVDGISAQGDGAIYGIMALSNKGVGFPSLLGHLLRVSPGGQIRDIANVGDFDYAWSNAHFDLANDFPDADPYAVLALGTQVYVADAASNTLDRVLPNGSIQILAFFHPNVLADSTPTCIAKGPDGALYIGTLALVDSLAFGHAATVYRVDLSQTDPGDMSKVLNVATPWATGLWPINGCAFGADGAFYASQLITTQQFSNGDVVKIPFATPSVHISLTGGTLLFPAGVAVGHDGSVFVSNGAAEVPVGQVVRLAKH